MPGLSSGSGSRACRFIRTEHRNGAVSELVSSSAMSLKLLLLSLSTFYVLTMLAFFLRLVPLWSTVSLSCHAPHPHSAACRSRKKRAFLFFYQGGKTFRKSPADFLMGAFDRIRLLDHAPAVGRLVKQVSAIFSLYTGRWALLRRGGGVEVAVD